MRTNEVVVLFLATGLWALLAPSPAMAQRPVRHPLVPRLPQAQAFYVRETEDREWGMRFVGKVEQLGGLGCMVYNADGKILRKEVIPPGPYTPQQPYTIVMPKDLITGDYGIVLTGKADDITSQLAPLTDLLQEVFSGTTFSFGHYIPDPYFLVPPGVTNLVIVSAREKPDISTLEGAPVTGGQASAKPDDPRSFRFRLPVMPGAVYRLKVPGHFGMYPAFYFAYEPQRLFVPDPEIAQIKWWRIVK